MPRPDRRWLHHATPDWVRFDQHVFFVTVCCATRGEALLVEPHTSEFLRESVGRRHESGTWWVHLFVIKPDHVHGLFSFPRVGAGMTRAIADWKRWTARSIGIRWQRGFFEHRLRGDESFEEKAHYVRCNPVRAGFVTTPEEWPHLLMPG